MAAIDLTTTAAVRAFMQVPAGETEQDPITATLITAASKAIMRHAQREFAPPRDGLAREFEYDGGGFLDLNPYDLRTFTSARGSDDDGVTWQDIERDSIKRFPRPNSEGVYTALRLECVHWPLIEVTGDWGWPSVPEDVESACTMAVAIWLRRDVSTFTTTFSIDEDRLERPESLPSAVRGMLAPYRRAAP